MPIYEYQCNECNHCFEYLTLKSDETAICPKCGKDGAKKLISATCSLTGISSGKCAPGNSSGFS